MTVYAGTSGYAYKEWKGSFYPEKLPNDEMLRYYAGQFRAVEINNTFYRMPKEEVLLRWAGEVPDGFTFVLKASRRITHINRLKEVDSSVQYLAKQASVLEKKLGPILFQLPPYLKKDVPRLQAFLELLSQEQIRAAMEFRHDSWFEGEIYEMLRSHNVALCLSDTDEQGAPRTVTASWGYLRLRRVGYDRPLLESWASWIGERPWADTFVFFKHEDEGAGPRLAKTFLEVVGEGRAAAG